MRHTLPLLFVALLAGCNGSSSSPVTAVPPVTSSPTPAPSPTSVGSTPFFQFTQTAAQSAYVDYTGPQRPALSPLRAGGRFVAAQQAWVFDAQMAGPVFTGGPNLYAFGVNRGGAGTSPFPDEPNVIFDSVAVVTADPANGTALKASVTLLSAAGTPNGAAPGVATAVLLAPDTIEVTVPLASLPSNGFATSAYTWNLWPRIGLGGAPAAQVAAFIPQNAEEPFGSF